jgi:GGDEF domain-containing protein
MVSCGHELEDLMATKIPYGAPTNKITPIPAPKYTPEQYQKSPGVGRFNLPGGEYFWNVSQEFINNPLVQQRFAEMGMEIARPQIPGPMGEYWVAQDRNSGGNFWTDARRIGRYYNAIKTMPDIQPPAWLDMPKLEAAYKELTARYGDDWINWGQISKDDPLHDFVKQMPAPPIEAIPDWERQQLARSFEVAKNIGLYVPPKQVGTVGPWTQYGIDEETWKQLPDWKKAALAIFRTMPGQAAQSALNFGILGLAFAGPVGGVIGLAGGAGLGVAQYKEMERAQQIIASGGVYQEPGWLKALALLDEPYRKSQELLGILTQLLYSAIDPEQYGSVEEILKNWEAAAAAGRGLYATVPAQIEVLLEQLTGKGTPGFTRIELTRPQDESIITPKGMPTQWALTEMRRALARGDITPDEVLNWYTMQFGFSGEFADLIGGYVLDPLDLTGVVGSKAIGKTAQLTGHPMAAEAFLKQPGRVPDLLTGARYYAHLARQLPVDQAAKLNPLARFIAGLDSQGRVIDFTKPENKNLVSSLYANVFGLTPKARAVSVLQNTVDGLTNLMTLEKKSPENMVDLVRSIANLTPEDAVQAATGTIKMSVGGKLVDAPLPRWFSSTEAQHVPLAIRDAMPKVEELLANYQKAEPERRVIHVLALALGQEPYAVLRDLHVGDNAKAQALLRDAIQSLGDYQKLSDAGKRTYEVLNAFTVDPDGAKKLKQIADGFYGAKAPAFDPDVFRYHLITLLADHADEWSARYFGLKKMGLGEALIDINKRVQGYLLLGLNPTYFVNNALNNIVTLAWDGLLNRRSPKARMKFLRDFDMEPTRLRQGIGAAEIGDVEFGRVEEIVGKKGIAKGERIGRHIEEAKEAQGAMAGVINFLKKGKKAQVFGILSQKVERWASEIAMINGIDEYFKNAWREGVAFERMSDELRLALDTVKPGLADKVKRAIESGMSKEAIERKIFKEIDTRSLDDVLTRQERNFLKQHFPEMYDELDEGLRNARSKQDIADVFERARSGLVRDLVNETMRNIEGRVEEAAQKAHVEKTQAVLDEADRATSMLAEVWLNHMFQMEMRAEEIRNLTGAERAREWRKLFEQQDAFWTLYQNQEGATWLGIFKGLGAEEASPEYVSAETTLLNIYATYRNFYQTRKDAFDNYWSVIERIDADETMPENMRAEARATAWEEVNAQVAREYRFMILAEDLLQDSLNKSFARQYQQQMNGDPQAYLDAMRWRESVQRVRRRTQQATLLFREGQIPQEFLDEWGDLLEPEVKQRILELNQGVPIHRIAVRERERINQIFYQTIYQPLIAELLDTSNRNAVGSTSLEKPELNLRPETRAQTEQAQPVAETAEVKPAEEKPQSTYVPSQPYDAVFEEQRRQEQIIWKLVAQELPEFRQVDAQGRPLKGSEQHLINFVRAYAQYEYVRSIKDITVPVLLRAIQEKKKTKRIDRFNAGYDIAPLQDVGQMPKDALSEQAVYMARALESRDFEADHDTYGFRNKGRMIKDLEKLAEQNKRAKKPKSYWTIAFDLRGLHLTNKKFGDLVGNAYIQYIGDVADSLGVSLYRIGGDEFAAIFEKKKDAENYAKQIQERVLHGTLTMKNSETGQIERYTGMMMHYAVGKLSDIPSIEDVYQVLKASEAQRNADPNFMKYDRSTYSLEKVEGETTEPPSEPLAQGNWMQQAEQMARVIELNMNDVLARADEPEYARQVAYQGVLEFLTERMRDERKALEQADAMLKIWDAMASHYAREYNTTPDAFYERFIIQYKDLPVDEEDLKQSRYVSSQWYYLKSQQAIEGAKVEKAPANQWLNILKSAQVKDEELRWMGLSNYLASKGNEVVTKQDLIDYLETEATQVMSVKDFSIRRKYFPKYELYSTYRETIRRGKDSADLREKFLGYNELLLQLPLYYTDSLPPDVELVPDNVLKGGYAIRDKYYGTVYEVDKTPHEAIRNFILGNYVYQSPHWSELNPIVHVRYTGFQHAGRTILYIDEIQSDWHQAGRRYGYFGELDRTLPEGYKIVDTGDTLGEKRIYAILDKRGLAITQIDSGDFERYQETGILPRYAALWIAQVENKVPPAPFSKNWDELAIKRMLRYAIEEGYSMIAISPGKVHEERWDLSKGIERLQVTFEDDGTGKPDFTKSVTLLIYPTEGKNEIERVNTYRELPSYIGEKLTEHVMQKADEGQILIDVDKEMLKTANAGVGKFYDERLIATANKYLKKWGKAFQYKEDALPFLWEPGAWVLDVDEPRMIDDLLAGQPLFQRVGNKWYSSKLLEEIDKARVNKATIGEWKRYLLGRGVSENEIYWSGVFDLFDDNDILTRGWLRQEIEYRYPDVKTLYNRAKRFGREKEKIADIEQSGKPIYGEYSYVAQSGGDYVELLLLNEHQGRTWSVAGDARVFADNPYDVTKLEALELLRTAVRQKERWARLHGEKLDVEWRTSKDGRSIEVYVDRELLASAQLNINFRHAWSDVAGTHWRKAGYWADRLLDKNEPLPFLHVRGGKIRTKNGKKAFFAEEIQSDLFQAKKLEFVNAEDGLPQRVERLDPTKFSFQLHFEKTIDDYALPREPEVALYDIYYNGIKTGRQAAGWLVERFKENPDEIISYLEQKKDFTYVIYGKKVLFFADESDLYYDPERYFRNFVNDFPFSDTKKWVELGLKRALHYAVKATDADYFILPSGVMNAALYYNTKKSPEKIEIMIAKNAPYLYQLLVDDDYSKGIFGYGRVNYLPSDPETNTAITLVNNPEHRAFLKNQLKEYIPHEHMIDQILDALVKQLQSGKYTEGKADYFNYLTVTIKLPKDNGVVITENPGLVYFYDKVVQSVATKLFKKWNVVPETETVKTEKLGKVDLTKIPITWEMRHSVEEGLPLFQRRKSPDEPASWYYSPTFRAVETMPQERMSSGQFLGYLKKRGLSREEMLWTGLDEYIARKDYVTKAELMEYLQRNSVELATLTKIEGLTRKNLEKLVLKVDDIMRSLKEKNPQFREERPTVWKRLLEEQMGLGRTKYEQYMPKFSELKYGSGKNYREFVLVPITMRDAYRGTIRIERAGMPDITKTLDVHSLKLNIYDTFRVYGLENLIDYKVEPDGKVELRFRSSEKPDNIFKITYEKEKMPDARTAIYRSTHFEDYGIVAHARTKELTLDTGERVLYVDEIQSDFFEELRQKQKQFEADKETKTSPQMADKILREFGYQEMPFAKKWDILVFKRMLHYAAERKMDGILIASGDIHTRRYAVPIEKIEIRNTGDGFHKLEYYVYTPDEGYEYLFSEYVRLPVENAAQVLHDRLNKSLVDGEFSLEHINRLLKEGNITFNRLSYDTTHGGLKKFYDEILPRKIEDYVKKWGVEPEAMYLPGEPNEFLFVPITDAMRRSVLEGQPLFSRRPADEDIPKGMTQFMKDGKALITIFKQSGDISTLVHETAHSFLTMLPKDDIAAVERWLKSVYQIEDLPEGWQYGTRTHRREKELFATAFEKYLAEGKAPNHRMKSIFEKFKRWLLDIYKSIRNIISGGEPIVLDENIRSVFDKWLSEEPYGLPKTKVDKEFENATYVHDLMSQPEVPVLRQEVPQPEQASRLTTARGQDVNKVYHFEYQVVPLDQLVISHLDNFSENPAYPSELQPRVRGRAASRDQVNRIASELSPGELLNDSPYIDRGPIIVGPDFVVESGNGRAMALRFAKENYPDKWQQYQNALAMRAQELGIDISGIENPILVRVRKDDVDRAAFAREANQIAVMAMSPAEKALQDAKFISDEALKNIQFPENVNEVVPIIASSKNADFVRSFVQQLPANERASMMDASGRLSSVGAQRIINAMFARVYANEAGARLITAFSESLDVSIRSLQSVLFRTLPAMANLEAQIGMGVVSPEYSIANDLSAAVDVIARLKQQGMSVKEFLSQATLFPTDDLTGFQRSLVKMIDDVGRETRKLDAVIRTYVDMALKQPPANQMTMFDVGRISKQDLFDAAASRNNVRFEVIQDVPRETARTVTEPPAETAPVAPVGEVMDSTAGRQPEPAGEPITELFGEQPVREQPVGEPVGEQPTGEQPAGEQPRVADAVGAPLGTYDSMRDAPMRDAMLEGTLRDVLPILDRAKNRALDAFSPEKAGGVRIPKETEDNLWRYLGGVYSNLADTRMGAIRWGETRRDFALLNYDRRHGYDTLLSAVFPYQFWYTRTMINWLLRMANKPSILANYYRLMRMASRREEKDGFPQRLKGKVPIPLPFLPEWMGQYGYVDPYRQIFPFLQLATPFVEIAEERNMLIRKTESILKEMRDNEEITDAQLQEALRKRNTPIWKRAYAQAENETEREYRNSADMLFSIYGPSLPIGIAYQYAMGTPERIGQMPLTRTIQNITGALGIGGPRGINIEGLVRTATGLPKIDRWEDYRVDRELSNMVADGLLDEQTAIRAMIERKGEAFEEAQRRVSQTGFVRMLGAGVALDIFPEGEAEMRALKNELTKAYEAQEKGDTQAVNKFWEKYPEYDARRMAMKNPQSRLRAFLISRIWERYLDLDPASQRMFKQMAGNKFTELFLDKKTRSYGSIDTDTLALWANTLGEKPLENVHDAKMEINWLPENVRAKVKQYYEERDRLFPRSETPQQTDPLRALFEKQPENNEEFIRWQNKYLAENPEIIPYVIGENNRLAGLPAEIQQYVYMYRAMRDELFPDIFQLQERYFALPQQQRRAFRAAHPELEQYWEFQRNFAAQYPKAAPYILTDESLARSILGERGGGRTSTGTGTGGTSRSVSPKPARPYLTPSELRRFSRGLIMQLYALKYRREALLPGARLEIERIWRSLGEPWGNLEDWIDNAVLPTIE